MLHVSLFSFNFFREISENTFWKWGNAHVFKFQFSKIEKYFEASFGGGGDGQRRVVRNLIIFIFLFIEILIFLGFWLDVRFSMDLRFDGFSMHVH